MIDLVDVADVVDGAVMVAIVAAAVAATVAALVLAAAVAFVLIVSTVLTVAVFAVVCAINLKVVWFVFAVLFSSVVFSALAKLSFEVEASCRWFCRCSGVLLALRYSAHFLYILWFDGGLLGAILYSQ